MQVSRYSKKEPPGHPYSSVEGGRWGAEEGVVADTRISHSGVVSLPNGIREWGHGATGYPSSSLACWDSYAES